MSQCFIRYLQFCFQFQLVLIEFSNARKQDRMFFSLLMESFQNLGPWMEIEYLLSFQSKIGVEYPKFTNPNVIKNLKFFFTIQFYIHLKHQDIEMYLLFF